MTGVGDGEGDGVGDGEGDDEGDGEAVCAKEAGAAGRSRNREPKKAAADKTIPITAGVSPCTNHGFRFLGRDDLLILRALLVSGPRIHSGRGPMGPRLGSCTASATSSHCSFRTSQSRRLWSMRFVSGGSCYPFNRVPCRLAGILLRLLQIPLLISFYPGFQFLCSLFQFVTV